MPDWTPRWDDVAFDHAAADRLAALARRLARSLDLDAQARAGMNATVLASWEGRLRQRAEPEMQAVPGELGDLADRLLRLVAHVEDAAAQAQADQRRREDDRARWRREGAVEQQVSR